MHGHVYYKRQFLNTEASGGHAFIEASVDEGGENRDGTRYFDAEFSVADCNRMVTLNFGVYSDTDSQNARQKITKLRRAIVAFEKQLLVQLDTVDKK